MDLGQLLYSPIAGDLVLLIGRVAIGVCFIIHAMGKIGVWGGGGMKGFADWLESLGVPFAPMQAQAAMLTELLGGAALVMGLMTRPACVALMGTMVVAGAIGHKGAGYLITNDPPGAEYTVNLGIICLIFAALGPGMYSVDYFLFAAG